jgi:hypothetical protein
MLRAEFRRLSPPKAPHSTDAPQSRDQKKNTCLTTMYPKVFQTLSAASSSVYQTCYVAARTHARTHHSIFGSAPMDVKAETLKLPLYTWEVPG